MKFTFAILAGGKNSRFNGFNKALLEIGDKTILQKQVEIAQNIADEIIIVSNDPESLNIKNCKIISDKYKDIGPMGGIHAALSGASFQDVFITACDMPFLNQHIILTQFEIMQVIEADIIIPELNGKLEPLHSFYKKRILDKAIQYIENNSNCKTYEFIKTVDYKLFSIDKDLGKWSPYTNINTPEDLDRIKRM